MRLIAWTLTWLAICPLAFGAATTITRYVDTDTGNDTTGDGSQGNPWATQSHARDQFKTYGENADGNFTTTGATYPDGIEGILYCSGSAADTAGVVWDVVTDSTHSMRIIGDGAYTHSVSIAANITIQTDCILFDDVHFVIPSTTAHDRRTIRLNTIGAGGWQRFRGCSFTGPDDAIYRSRLVHVEDTDAVVELNNCKLIDAGSVEGSLAIYAYAGTIYIYNCTIDNSYYGIDVNNVAIAKVYAKNTIVTGSAGNAYNKGENGTLELTYCTSDDATATTYDTGSTCTNSVSPTFTGDYQLASTDTTWIDGGMDLSADAHWHDDNVDAWDTARPQGSAWDIGWHEQDSGDSDELVLLRRRRAGD